VSFRKLIAWSVVIWAAVVAATYVAGEQTEVARLETRDELGKEWVTKLWVVDIEGVPWVRVANPTRAWYLRLLANPRVELERGGRREARLAAPDDSPATHAIVDEAFAEKYGWVDAWYGLIARRNAVPIRLNPVAADP